MKNAMMLASAALTSIVLLSGPAASQGARQTVGVAAVDAHSLSAGYRASKVIGSKVLNNANETIGKIDDILVSSDGKEPFAVISVGGFLGMGARLIIVRYDSLQLVGNEVVLPNGTKEGLKALPEFNYATQ
jgi:hypothetical protein